MNENFINVSQIIDGQIVSVRQEDLFPGLTWETRPDMTHSKAPENLQRAWVAVVMAYRERFGCIAQGHCLQLSYIARPLFDYVLSEPVQLCAGFAWFITGKGVSDSVEFGRQYCPARWYKLVYGDGPKTASAPGVMDYHVWLKTKTHVIDPASFQIAPGMRESNKQFPVKGAEGTFPPMLYWPFKDLPSGPKEAWGDRKLLLVRDDRAVKHATTIFHRLADKLTLVVPRAMEIYAALQRGETVEAAPTDLTKAMVVG